MHKGCSDSSATSPCPETSRDSQAVGPRALEVWRSDARWRACLLSFVVGRGAGARSQGIRALCGRTGSAAFAHKRFGRKHRRRCQVRRACKSRRRWASSGTCTAWIPFASCFVTSAQQSLRRLGLCDLTGGISLATRWRQMLASQPKVVSFLCQALFVRPYVHAHVSLAMPAIRKLAPISRGGSANEELP